MIKHTPRIWSRKIKYFFWSLLISLIFNGCGPTSFQIANWQKTGAIEPLIETLKDKEWYARGQAAEALGKLKAVEAVDPLLAVALNDKDTYVRKKAALALGEIGNDSAIEAINTLLGQAEQRFCNEKTEVYHMLATRFP